jgi:molybdate transport system substrate-binding protein
MSSASRVLAAAVLAVGLTACGDGPDEGTTITVFAASSLTDTFEEIGHRFEAEHHGVTVEFSFGGSSDLVTQIQGGAPADVFASADEATMAKAANDELTATRPEIFATNTLTIAVQKDNPRGVEGLADLGGGDLDVVVCAPEVPCGAATTKVEKSSGIDVRPVSEEQNVTDVLNKVIAGEADAGLVYVTDVIAAGDRVTGVELDEAGSAVNVYPIATVGAGDEAALAQEFVDLVLGPAGQAVLQQAGFGKP